MATDMKKLFCVLAVLFLLSGCSVPDSLQLDLSQGYGRQVKLLHLNASSSQRRQRIEEFAALLEESQPLEKDISLFAYYPDYLMEITRDGQKTSVILDVNGDFIDFHYVEGSQLYRSSVSAGDFKKLLHQYAM